MVKFQCITANNEATKSQTERLPIDNILTPDSQEPANFQKSDARYTDFYCTELLTGDTCDYVSTISLSYPDLRPMFVR